MVRQAEYLISDGAMVANVDSTRFCRLIVLVTNRALVRDLEVSVLPNLMFFRRTSFWTGLKTHKYKISQELLGRIGLRDRDEMELNLDSQTWWCLKLPW